MMRSLYSGVAGLKTHQTKMDVIGNNIANVNTVAFKATQTTFSDVMYQNMSNATGPTDTLGGVNAKQIGIGSLTAATKNTIDSAGAAQSTGEAFDVRLSDGNATNFFIVSNGSEQLFTRSGSLYIDGAGNLAMTSTGYMVQGWQAEEDELTGEINIIKDTVSPLRLMTPENQTSNPENTTEAYVSGLLDKNDKNINSDSGYNMSLGFYDNEGFLYTAKFAVKTFDKDTGTYTVSLSSVYDENNNDVLKTYYATTKQNLTQLTDQAGNKLELEYDYNLTINASDVSALNVNQVYKTTSPTTGINVYVQVTNAVTDPTTGAITSYEVKKYDDDSFNEYLKSKIFGSEDGTARNNYARTSKYYQDDLNNIITQAQDPLLSEKVTYTLKTDNFPAKYEDASSDNYITDADIANKSDEQLRTALAAAGKTAAASAHEGIFMIPAHSAYLNAAGDLVRNEDDYPRYYVDLTNDKAGTKVITRSIEEVWGTPSTSINDMLNVDANAVNFSITVKDGSLNVYYKSTNYELDFSEADGGFNYIASAGQGSVPFNVQNLGISALTEEIDTDFSKLLDYNNGGSATAGMDRGNKEDPTVHAGKKLGTLTGLAIQQNGEIYGSYDNGNTVLLGQIAVAQFPNASGLEALGSNLFRTTLNSGEFNGIGTDITNDGGKMETGQLEMSNVDLSREFTEMITTQRGFQANSRIITVSDTLLEELTNLKR